MPKYNLRATIYYWEKSESTLDPKRIEIMQWLQATSQDEAFSELDNIVLLKEKDLIEQGFDVRHDMYSVSVDLTPK